MLYFDKITPRNIRMRRTLLILTTAMTLMGTLHATEIITDATKLQEISTKNVVFKDPTLSIKGAIEKPYNYILKLEARSAQGSQNLTAFLDKQSGELHFGTAYDKEGHAITFPIDAKVVQEGVAFSYGKGSKEIYIVTDPECPYCTRFEKAVLGKLDEYRVHVIFFPLSFHKKAPAMVEWIMLGKDDVSKKERFEQVMLKGSTEYSTLIKDVKKPFVYSPEIAKEMKKMDAAVRELKVRGTPAIYDANFEPLPQDQLFKGLKK
jgi:thiol:disulfide interchange protein DsbC